MRSSRTNYPVVTWLVVGLATIAGTIRALQPAIPPPPAVEQAINQSGFVGRGRAQPVRWRALSDAALTEARRLEKPIFLLISSVWSRFGRVADRTGFDSVELAQYLDAEFVPIRVDTVERPEWLTAFQPLTRARTGYDPAFQIQVLNPDGTLIASYMRRGAEDQIDVNVLEYMLQNARRIASKARATRTQPAAAEEQAREASDLTGPRKGASIDYDAQLRRLRANVHPRFGGVPNGSFQSLAPSAWRLMLAAGDRAALDASLGPMLQTPIVDWLDGGFFRQSSKLDWSEIEFDKLAVQNAEMALLLAQRAALWGDPLDRYLAGATIDTLFGAFRASGVLDTAQIGDEGEMNRSARSSFSPKFLRQNFSESDREWLRQVFRLRVEENAQMALALRRGRSFLTASDRISKMLARLRELRADKSRRFSEQYTLDVNGHCAARLLEAARLMNDPNRLGQAGTLFDALKRFRAGEDDVVHNLIKDASSYRYLGDYIAYADAAFQDYLAYGRTDSFAEGLRVLRRALTLFGSPDTGVLANGLSSDLLRPLPNVQVPSLLDDLRESTTAATVRLLYAYASVLGGKQAVSLNRKASAIVAQYSGFVERFGLKMSGFVLAAQVLEEGAYALVLGPNATVEAGELARRLPTRLIAPITAEMRPDLAARGNGFYITQYGRMTGPMTARQAFDALRPPWQT